MNRKLPPDKIRKDWQYFLVTVLAFIGLWHVLSGGLSALQILF